MNLVYDSDSFAVMQVVLGAEGADAPADGEPRLARGGYEIVDKLAREGVFLGGAVAEHFRAGVQALAADHTPSVEEIDDYIAGYALLARQPLAMH